MFVHVLVIKERTYVSSLLVPAYPDISPTKPRPSSVYPITTHHSTKHLPHLDAIHFFWSFTFTFTRSPLSQSSLSSSLTQAAILFPSASRILVLLLLSFWSVSGISHNLLLVPPSSHSEPGCFHLLIPSLPVHHSLLSLSTISDTTTCTITIFQPSFPLT